MNLYIILLCTHTHTNAIMRFAEFIQKYLKGMLHCIYFILHSILFYARFHLCFMLDSIYFIFHSIPFFILYICVYAKVRFDEFVFYSTVPNIYSIIVFMCCVFLCNIQQLLSTYLQIFTIIHFYQHLQIYISKYTYLHIYIVS